MVVLLIRIEEVEMKELKLAPNFHGLFLKKHQFYRNLWRIKVIENCKVGSLGREMFCFPFLIILTENQY